MLQNNERSTRPCSDCEGLKKGMRSGPEPHQYMVVSANTGSDAGKKFLCLVCGSALVRQGEGNATRWI